MYASVVRRRMAMPKPEPLSIGVNGHWLKVKHYDSDEVLFELPFKDFRPVQQFEALPLFLLRKHPHCLKVSTETGGRGRNCPTRYKLRPPTFDSGSTFSSKPPSE